MENGHKNFYKELKYLDGNIDELLSNKTEVEKAAFYEALKLIVNLKIDVEEIHSKFNELEEVFAAMSIGQFDVRVDIPNRRTIFSYVGAGLNTVIEQQERNLIKKQYCQALLKTISDFAIITDKKGVILFANPTACTLLNRSNEDLNRLYIANIFESQKQFGVESPDLNNFRDIPITIQPYNEDDILLIYLTVEPVLNKKNELDGYIYIGKTNLDKQE